MELLYIALIQAGLYFSTWVVVTTITELSRKLGKEGMEDR